MLSRLSPFLRIVPPAHSQLAAEPMAAARALTFRLVPPLANSPLAPLSPSQNASSSASRYPISLPLAPPLRCPSTSLYWQQQSSIFGPAAALSCKDDRRLFWSVSRGFGRVFASWREYRKARRKPAPPTARAKAKRKEKELELSVNICIEEQLPDDPEILDIAELLRVNVPMAMKLGLEGLKDSAYQTRDNSITDVGGFESVELSVLLCNDEFICKLNKEWRGEDHPTDVLSMSQHVPELKLPVLMLGDIVISVETAARQAEERGHTLLDEIRILLVHGLLHLLGFDHEISDEAEAEMEKEEEHLLKSLGWKGKGLIQSAYDAETNGSPPLNHPDDRKREGCLRFYRPRFNFIFCDMDGTLLNSKSQVSTSNAKALKEAISRGVKIVIATGKTRPAVISLLKNVDLAGKGGAISEFSPGVFLQILPSTGVAKRLLAWKDGIVIYLKGLLVYGRQGREIFRRNLDPNVCREASMYSLKHQIPLIAFSEDRCLTLFEHPFVDSLHTVYSEPKAEIIPTVEQLLAGGDIQKLIFLDSAEGVATTLRPYWAEATGDYASVVQAVPDMLEIVPSGTSKGSGVRLLLDHLGASPTEVMAIGDGENDVEMLELASLGVALSNGSEKAKAVADVVGLSNDEDGAADAIYRYAF